MDEKKKMGRPTDYPKPYRMVVRFGEIEKQILKEYCKEQSITETEAVRQGIRKLGKKK